nr:PREDICTED: integumentary mucin C.1-like [Lepisosteus oculatus]
MTYLTLGFCLLMVSALIKETDTAVKTEDKPVATTAKIHTNASTTPKTSHTTDMPKTTHPTHKTTKATTKATSKSSHTSIHVDKTTKGGSPAIMTSYTLLLGSLASTLLYLLLG